MPDVFTPLPATFLPALLDLLPTGVAYYLPVVDAAGAVVDFTFGYLNPAARRLLRLPGPPAATYREQWPNGAADEAFAFLRAALLADAPAQPAEYVAHGRTTTIRAHARRLEAGLLVSFSADPAQSQAQQAQQREQDLQRLLEQAPVAVSLMRGPRHVVTLMNETNATLLGSTLTHLLGKPILEALPVLQGQGFEAVLNRVLAGETVVFQEIAVVLNRRHLGRADEGYYHVTYQPWREGAGEVTGVMAIAVEVTDQVRARQQVEAQERQATSLNHQLQAAHAETLANNAALERTQAQLRQLNQELEARVRERTRQLEAQQSLLQQILKQMPAAIATLSGPEHRFSFANEQYQELAGGRATLGQTVAQVLPEVVEQGFLGLLDRAYATGEAFRGHEIAIMLARPGAPATQQYLDFTYQPLTDGQGLVHGILVFAVDVTAQVRNRRQAETLRTAMLAVAQRRAQERQDLYQVFEQAPVAIVLLREPDHRIDYFNPAFAELFPTEEWTGPIQGHTVGEVYPRVRLAGLVALLDEVFRTGESQVVLDMPLENLQPGSPRYVTFSYQAYREQDRIVGVAAFVYDVTEQVVARQQVQQLNQELAAINAEMQATNQELHHANARLTRTNTDLDTFVYSASHDLKSPITNIEGLLMALRQHLPPEALGADLVSKLLGMMDGAVARFQQTLGHLTDVSQLQQASSEQPVEAVDLPALVEAVRLDILPELSAAGATLAVDVAACPTVHFLAKNLRSILYNLLSNAIKYRAPDRPAQVWLHCAPAADGALVLRVRDNGLGLSEQQQSQLFRLFRRLHTHVPGSGVGLYMVKRMVENAGGTLTLHSQPGVGSTFTVTVPLPGPASR
jgi:PAS domain S-box-containing protein